MENIKASPYGTLRGLAPYVRLSNGNRMNHSMLSKAIHGDREISIAEARQLADLLGVPMSEVIRRIGVPFGKRDNVT